MAIGGKINNKLLRLKWV